MTAPLATGNAVMSFYPFSAAPLSIQVATPCGGRFLEPGQTLTGDPKNPANSLGNISIQVSDSHGSKPAAILSAAQDQIEYILPEGTAPGTAELAVAIGAVTWLGTVDVKPLAPRVLESAPAIAAAFVLRVRNGGQTVEPIFAAPIDLGPEGDSVYLCVFGTGWRATLLRDVTLEYSGINGPDFRVPAIYAGPQGEYAGLDQVNFLLPRGLAGSNNRYTLHTFLNVQGNRVGVPGLVYK